MIPIYNEQHFKEWIAEQVFIPRIRKSFISGAAITIGMGVCIGVDGKVYPYTHATTDRYVGIATATVAINTVVIVIMQGYLRVEGSGWEAGSVYYLQNGGTLVTGVEERRIGLGVAEDTIIISSGSGGVGTTVQDGYAKSLMLMGG